MEKENFRSSGAAMIEGMRWRPIADAPEDEPLLLFFPAISSRTPSDIKVGWLPRISRRHPSHFMLLPPPPLPGSKPDNQGGA